jgi:hypothetical protein
VKVLAKISFKQDKSREKWGGRNVSGPPMQQEIGVKTQNGCPYL